MKIIGHTTFGYLTEVSKDEMQTLTGKSEHYGQGCQAHPVGSILNVPQLSKHIEAMAYTKQQRANAAEALRAAATVIESTPDAFTAPEPPAAVLAEPANQ
jgi:hypothetical protein